MQYSYLTFKAWSYFACMVMLVATASDATTTTTTPVSSTKSSQAQTTNTTTMPSNTTSPPPTTTTTHTTPSNITPSTVAATSTTTSTAQKTETPTTQTSSSTITSTTQAPTTTTSAPTTTTLSVPTTTTGHSKPASKISVTEPATTSSSQGSTASTIGQDGKNSTSAPSVSTTTASTHAPNETETKPTTSVTTTTTMSTSNLITTNDTKTSLGSQTPVTTLSETTSSSSSSSSSSSTITTTTTTTTSETPSSTTTVGTSKPTTPSTTITDAPSSTTVTSSSSTPTTPVDHCNPDPCANGTCSNLGNDYNCTCTPGYTGRNCSQDINECDSSPCSDNADCFNSPGSYICTCKPGYTENGTTCTDIDECENSAMCDPNAECTNSPGSYKCTCKSGYTGNGTTCSDVDECHSNPCHPSANCTNTVGSFYCTCNPGYYGNGTTCTDINECENSTTCDPNAECINSPGSFKCTCKPGYTGNGTTCSDIDECDTRTHKCHNKASCTNAVGFYNCSCNTGYFGDGFTCYDIDECADNNDTCNRNNSQCWNTNGGYVCICNSGWNGTDCNVDIDECLSSPCSANATCNNTAGNFTCSCDDGFRGDGYKCVQNVLIYLSGGSGHQGDDETYGPFNVPGGLPYQQKLYYSIFVNMNGYISLGRKVTSRYPPRNSTSWKETGVPVIAPLWADIETKNDSRLIIYDSVNITELDGTLSSAGTTLLKPRYAFVATWNKAVPYPYDQNAKYETADFQVVILTDGSETQIIYNYDHEIFSWNASFRGRYINIGYSNADLGGVIEFDQHNFTEANGKSNTNLNGRWVFTVSGNDVTLATEARCQAWLDDDKLQANLKQMRRGTEPCPCSLSQAFRDARFRFTGYQGTDNYYVFQARFPRSPNNNKQKCHYSNTGSLVTGFPGGGYPNSTDSSLKITEAYDDCCVNSTRLCRMFYAANPSDNCGRYRPPTWRPSWGDPHITTLDGKEYTFNGRGEYTFLHVSSENVTVQVRTELAASNSTDATVFVGLAAREKDGDTVEIVLDRAHQSCKIFVNGSQVNTSFPDNNFGDIDGNRVSVYRVTINTTNALVVAFQSGVSIQVTVSDILDLVASLSDTMRGNVSGLLGNFDNNTDNDFVLTNGTILATGSSEEQLFVFGSSWKINETAESLFNYSASGGNFSFFNNDTIKPKNFIGDISNLTEYLNSRCHSMLNTTDISAACGSNKACVIDSAATCNVTFGKTSKQTQETVEQQKLAIDNTPPKFNNNDTIMVVQAQLTERFLDVSDSDVNDTVTVAVETNISSSSYSYNASTKVFTWNVTEDLRKNVVHLKFVARDSMNASAEFWPNIYFCGCNQSSQCDYTTIANAGSNPDKFYRASCKCPSNATGEYCDSTVNVCDPSPCYPGVTCNQTLPDKPCGQCPDGYTGNGYRCTAIDQCRDGSAKCDQKCHNTNGSYFCTCNASYVLNSDNHTCDDIDECATADNNCTETQYCHNWPGFFTCGCLPGYIETGNGDCKKARLSFVLLLFVEIVGNPSEYSIKESMKSWVNQIIFTGEFSSIDVIIEGITNRKRRETTPTSTRKYKLTFVLYSDNNTLTTKDVKETFENFVKTNDTNGTITGQQDSVYFKIDTKRSKVYDDEDSPLCRIIGASRCDPLSTTCKVVGARPVCECKDGFKEWSVPGESCEDINECNKTSEFCKGGLNCTNLPGTYICQCHPGYQYDRSDTKTCQDLCQTNPCQNGGTCTHGNKENQYICKCEDKWAGANCERENEETSRLKIIAIVVGSVVGGVCLLLLLALIGVYRRSVARRRGYARYSTYNYGLDSDFSIPRPNLSREKDDPLDDQNTTFSIPRPKIGNIEMTDLDAQSNGSDSERYAKADDTDSATQPLSSSPRDELQGKENPSFLHDESTTNIRKSRAGARSNPYEYF